MSALEPRRRADAVPANRVTVLDPEPSEPAPTGQTFVYVHIDTLNLTQPAAPVQPRPLARRAASRKRRRRTSPAMRALVRPIVVLAMAVAVVYLARVVLTDPAALTDHARMLTQ